MSARKLSKRRGSQRTPMLGSSDVGRLSVLLAQVLQTWSQQSPAASTILCRYCISPDKLLHIALHLDMEQSGNLASKKRR